MSDIISLPVCYDDYADCYRVDGDHVLVWAGDLETTLSIPNDWELTGVNYDPTATDAGYAAGNSVSLVLSEPSPPLAATGINPDPVIAGLLVSALLIGFGIWALAESRRDNG